jgi:hypothetical protein
MNPKEYQYYHELDAYTVVCKVPSKEQFIEYLVNQAMQLTPMTIKIKLGAAFVHPKDQFSYKTGRETAMSKIKYENFQLTRVSYSEKETLVDLYAVDMDCPVSVLRFSITDGRKTPYLVKAC